MRGGRSFPGEPALLQELEDQEGEPAEREPDRRPDDQREGEAPQEAVALLQVLVVPFLVGGEVHAGRERARGELLPETAVAGRTRRQHVGGNEPPPAGDAAEEPSRDRAGLPELDALVGGAEGGAGRRRPLVIDPKRAHRGSLTELFLRAWACGVFATTRTTSLLPRAALRSRRQRVTFPLGPVEVACGRRARRPRFVEETLTRAPWIRRPRRSLTVTTIFRRCWRWTLPFRYRTLTIRTPMAFAAETVCCAVIVSELPLESTASSVI